VKYALLCLLLASVSAPSRSAEAEDFGVFYAGTAGYLGMLNDSGPSGVYGHALTVGARGGFYAHQELTFGLDGGIEFGLAGSDFDAWFLEIPNGHVGVGVSGELTTIMLHFGAGLVGIDTFSDDVTLSILNPKLGFSFDVRPDPVWMRLDLELDHKLRLNDQTDVTSLHLRFSIGWFEDRR